MLACPEGRRSALTIKRLMVARDFQEVINYSFVDRRELARVKMERDILKKATAYFAKESL